MRAAVLLAAAAGCAHPLDDDQPCLEVGYAIASRTAECEDSDEAGVARFDLFESRYTCDLARVRASENDVGLYECAFVLRNLACELVVDYGDDLDRWMASSPACAAILEPR
jgi:hypothetical protein